MRCNNEQQVRRILNGNKKIVLLVEQHDFIPAWNHLTKNLWALAIIALRSVVMVGSL